MINLVFLLKKLLKNYLLYYNNFDWFIKIKSANTKFVIAIPTGTALIPTQGSWRPIVLIFVFLRSLEIVFFSDNTELVGLTMYLKTISCPDEIPPKIPPAWLLWN